MRDFTKENHLLIRARRKEHLESFAAGAGVEVKEDSDADYRYRVSILKSEFIAVMSEKMESIEYTNFKDSVSDDELHRLYMGVWHDVRVALGD